MLFYPTPMLRGSTSTEEILAFTYRDPNFNTLSVRLVLIPSMTVLATAQRFSGYTTNTLAPLAWTYQGQYLLSGTAFPADLDLVVYQNNLSSSYLSNLVSGNSLSPFPNDNRVLVTSLAPNLERRKSRIVNVGSASLTTNYVFELGSFSDQARASAVSPSVNRVTLARSTLNETLSFAPPSYGFAGNTSKLHQEQPLAYAWRPNGSQLHSHDVGGIMTFNSNAEFVSLTSISNGTNIRSLQWRPDGSRLAIGRLASGVSDPGLVVLNSSLSVPLNEAFGRQVNTVSWSPSGKYIAATFTDAPYLGIWEFKETFFLPLSLPINTTLGPGLGCAFQPPLT